MKKLIPLTILVVVILGGTIIVTQHQVKPTETTKSAHPANDPKVKEPVEETSSANERISHGIASPKENLNRKEGSEEDVHDKDDRREAVEIYHSAEEALAAVKKGAVDYDDSILEQFADIGDDCSWCASFFNSVKEMMLSPDINQDQRSYYAELLAASGKVQNIATLVDVIKNTSSTEVTDAYAEALELTLGDAKVVSFLGEQLSTNNPVLQEALIAALTNHGTRSSVELLYKNTVEKGDSDGYYSKGIGLGELIPDENDPETLPYLQDLALKRDAYSHLAIKALLNAGLPGLRIVLGVLSNSKNPEFDRAMLKDAVDHVNYDEATEKAMKEALKNSAAQPVITDFAKAVLDDFGNQGEKQTDEIVPDNASNNP